MDCVAAVPSRADASARSSNRPSHHPELPPSRSLTQRSAPSGRAKAALDRHGFAKLPRGTTRRDLDAEGSGVSHRSRTANSQRRTGRPWMRWRPIRGPRPGGRPRRTTQPAHPPRGGRVRAGPRRPDAGHARAPARPASPVLHRPHRRAGRGGCVRASARSRRGQHRAVIIGLSLLLAIGLNPIVVPASARSLRGMAVVW